MAILERWVLLVCLILSAAMALYYAVLVPRVKSPSVRRGLKWLGVAVVGARYLGGGRGDLPRRVGATDKGWKGPKVSFSIKALGRTCVSSVSKLRAESKP